MSFITELIALVVVGDARYGRDVTPLDKLNSQANKGLEIFKNMKQDKRKSK